MVATLGALAAAVAILAALIAAGRWFSRQFAARRRARASRRAIEQRAQALAEFTSKYVDVLLTETSHFEFPGLRRHILFRSIRQPSWVVSATSTPTGPDDESDSTNRVEQAEFDQDSPLDWLEPFQNGEAAPWAAIDSTQSRWLVLGPAGSGKSTLIRFEVAHLTEQLQADLSRSEPKPLLVPVHVSAEALHRALLTGGVAPALWDSVAARVQRNSGLFVLPHRDLAETLLQAPNEIALLVDALEERLTIDEQKQFLHNLEFALPDNVRRLIVTSRQSAETTLRLKDGMTVCLQRFSVDRDAPAFVQAWFAGTKGAQSRALQLAEALVRDPNVRELAGTPLCLAFLCLSLECADEPLATRQVDLFEQVLRGLLQTWPNERAPRRRFGAVKLRALECIAWNQWRDRACTRSDLLIAQLLKELRTDYGFTFEDIGALLTEITDIDCIMQVSSAGLAHRYTFFHRFMLEYLAARATSHDPHKTTIVMDAVREGRLVSEVPPILAGLLKDPAPLLDAILEAPVDQSIRVRVLDACIRESSMGVSDQQCLLLASRLQHEVQFPWRNLSAYRLVRRALVRVVEEGRCPRPFLQLFVAAHDLVLNPDLDSATGGTARLRLSATPAIEALVCDVALVRWSAVWTLALLRDPRAEARLTEALGDTDAEVRSLCAWAVSICRLRGAIEHVRRLLSDPEARVRKSAASTLGVFADIQAVEALCRLSTEDPDSQVRGPATWALAQMPQQHRLDADTVTRIHNTLSTILDDPVPTVLSSVISALNHLANQGGAAVLTSDRLLAYMSHDSDNVRSTAIFAARRVFAGPAMIQALLRCLNDPQSSVRSTAASTLGHLGVEEAAPELCELLCNQPMNVYRSAVWTLRRLRTRSEVRTRLIAMLENPDKKPPAFVLNALLHWRDASLTASVIAHAKRMTGGTDFGRRVQGIKIFGAQLALAPHQEALEGLAALMTDNDGSIRDMAFRQMLSAENASAVEAAVAALKGRWSDRTLAVAIVVLTKRKRTVSVETMRGFLMHPNSGVRVAACHYFQDFPDSAAQRDCVTLLRDPDPWVRASACESLKQAPAEYAAPHLDGLIESETDSRVLAALCVLAGRHRIGASAVGQRRLLLHPDPVVRAQACRYYRLMRDVSVMDACLDLLDDADARARTSACVYVEVLAGACAGVEQLTPRLITMLVEDPDALVRHHALLALAKRYPIAPREERTQIRAAAQDTFEDIHDPLRDMAGRILAAYRN